MNSTAALIISVVIAFGITAGLGFVIIPWLRKLKFGQTILDIGPKWHKSKQGTPNMGGLMFIIGIVISFALTVLIYHLSGGNLESEYSSIMNGRELVLLLAGLILALGCGAVGFIDDFTKIKLKRNEGLSPKQKTLGQQIVTLGYIATLWMSHNTSWYIPFIGRVNFEKNIGEEGKAYTITKVQEDDGSKHFNIEFERAPFRKNNLKAYYSINFLSRI